MSTTFDVYPRTKEIPTFEALLDRATTELHQFLESVNILAKPPIRVQLQRCEGDAPVPFSLGDPAAWDEALYAWFRVGETLGGTDAYFCDDPDEIRELWGGSFDEPRCKRLEPLINDCFATGHSWRFRRSAGQPAVINLTYGLLAASLAALTDGFIDSWDSAWELESLPALPDEFLSWYFRPELAVGKGFREWSQRCLDGLAEELC